MQIKPLMIFSSGVAVALLVGQVLPEGDSEFADRGPAVQIAAPNSTVATQKSGTKPKPSTDSGDGFGTLYAAATYRISTEGCDPGEVRIIRIISNGPNANLLGQSSDCVLYQKFGFTGSDAKAQFQWSAGFPLTWPNLPKLYVQDTNGAATVVIDVNDSILPGGRFEFDAEIVFTRNTQVMNPAPQVAFLLRFLVTEDDDRSEIDLASIIADTAASISLTSPPVLVYSIPTL